MFNEFHVINKSAKTMVLHKRYSKILKQNGVLILPDYIHFVILRNFYNKKETVSIKYLNNLYFVNLNALSNHSSANTNASCCLCEKKSRAEINTEEKILKKIQKLEANQR